MIDNREDYLRGKYNELCSKVESFPLDLPDITLSLTEVEERFQGYEELRKNFDDIPGDKGVIIENFYSRISETLYIINFQLDMIQSSLRYIELHERQINSEFNKRIEHAKTVANEILSLYDIDVTVVPIILQDFAILPLSDKLPELENQKDFSGEIQILNLPLGDLERHSSIIAHELGHTILTESEIESNFDDVLEDRMDEWNSRMFQTRWDYWYEELFCDGCGILTFGPSYIFSLLHHTYSHDPYKLSEGSDTHHHPPESLRYQFVLELSNEVFPKELIKLNPVEKVMEDYEDHLRLRESKQTKLYSQHTDCPDLLYEIKEDVKNQVPNELEQLQQNIMCDETDPSFEERVKANEYWLEG